jgi:hypothetical protein
MTNTKNVWILRMKNRNGSFDYLIDGITNVKNVWKCLNPTDSFIHWFLNELDKKSQKLKT